MNTKILLACGTAAVLSACSADITARSKPAIIVEGLDAPARRMAQSRPAAVPSPALPRMGLNPGRIPWRAPDMTKDLYQEGRNKPSPLPPGSSTNGSSGPTASVGSGE